MVRLPSLVEKVLNEKAVGGARMKIESPQPIAPVKRRRYVGDESTVERFRIDDGIFIAAEMLGRKEERSSFPCKWSTEACVPEPSHQVGLSGSQWICGIECGIYRKQGNATVKQMRRARLRRNFHASFPQSTKFRSIGILVDCDSLYGGTRNVIQLIGF